MTIRYIPLSFNKMGELKLSTETYGARASLPPSSELYVFIVGLLNFRPSLFYLYFMHLINIYVKL